MARHSGCLHLATIISTFRQTLLYESSYPLGDVADHTTYIAARRVVPHDRLLVACGSGRAYFTTIISNCRQTLVYV